MDPKVVKLIVKSGLKLLSPLLGSFVSDGGSELIGLLIDKRTATASGAVLERLLRRVETELQSIVTTEGNDLSVAPIMATVESIVSNEYMLRAAWQDSGYDADQASQHLIDSNPRLLTGLSSQEASLSQRMIEVLFRAAEEEKKFLDLTEAHFRRTVLAKLDTLLAHPLPSAVKDQLVIETVLDIACHPFIPDISPPGALLRADIDRPVPFHGRDQELAELRFWSASDRPLEVRLVTGAGGMGKTRLMAELCRQVRKEGWASGFLEKEIKGDLRSILTSVLRGTKCVLIVIDYAENRRNHIIELVAAALDALGHGKTRIVLLARAADDWWEVLRGEGAGVGDVLSGPASTRMALRPLASTVAERKESYGLATRHFAHILLQTNQQVTELEFTDLAFDRALLLHMAALASIEGVPVKGDQGVLDHALDRERRFWRDRAQALGLDRLYERAIFQAVAAITLAGGVGDRAAATQVLRSLPLLNKDSAVVLDAIAQLLHDVYSGEKWIDPILPDLLGEHVVQRALGDDPSQLLDIVLGKPAQ